ncbi:conserved hypothetical protein [Burkholderia diffusa]|uniref:IcmT/TraK family protein n=1 Tax=Burkholderia diffusa TaxID=488732 RepID=UPI001CABEA4F|nr:IcmT/TraK family protein [Burkholderia diffusa]CAG9261002.1 conserved hypothetical protein [Burkholderia diffusa]
MSRSIWRDVSRIPKLAGIPCIAYLPIFIWLFHMRLWTLYLAGAVIIFFAVLAKYGLTFKVLWAKLVHLLRGSRLYARPWWYRNRFRDHQ